MPGGDPSFPKCAGLGGNLWSPQHWVSREAHAQGRKESTRGGGAAGTGRREDRSPFAAHRLPGLEQHLDKGSARHEQQAFYTQHI